MQIKVTVTNLKNGKETECCAQMTGVGRVTKLSLSNNEVCQSPDECRILTKALKQCIEEDLQEGRRVNIPGIGYLSLSADLDMDELKPDSKVRADYVSMRGIKFRANANLVKEVKRKVHFEKSQYTSRSYPFSEETLKEKIREYLKTNRSINRRVLEREFYIRKQTALNWLNRLVDSGFLIKEGARNSPVYFLAEE